MVRWSVVPSSWLPVLVFLSRPFTHPTVSILEWGYSALSLAGQSAPKSWSDHWSVLTGL